MNLSKTHYERIDIWNKKQPEKFKKLYATEMLRYKQLLLMIPQHMKKIIDIGCGKGYMDYLLAKKGFLVTAVDIDNESLLKFKKIAQDYRIKQINKDFNSLDLKGYDIILSQEVLEHLEDYKKALKKYASFIKKSGYGLFSVPYKENLQAKMVYDSKTGDYYHRNFHLHSFDKQKFVDGIKWAGFKIKKIKLLTNKRLIKLLAFWDLPVNKFSLFLDSIMNFIFPHKATYIAILCEKKENNEKNMSRNF